jgi:hypothetical protein
MSTFTLGFAPDECPGYLIESGNECPVGKSCQNDHFKRRCACGTVVSFKDYVSHLYGQKHRENMVVMRERMVRGQKKSGKRNQASQDVRLLYNSYNLVVMVSHSRTTSLPHPEPSAIKLYDVTNAIKSFSFPISKSTANSMPSANVTIPPWRSSSALRMTDTVSCCLIKRALILVLWQKATKHSLLRYRFKIRPSGRSCWRPLRHVLHIFLVPTGITMTRGLFGNFHSSTFAYGRDSLFRFTLRLNGASRWLPPERPRIILIQFLASYPGRYEDRLQLSFFDPESKQRFLITRPLLAVVGSKNDHDLLQPKAPYVRKKRTYVPITTEINFTLRPPSWSPIKWRGWLPRYDVPQEISSIISTGSESRNRNKMIAAIRSLLPTAFQLKTYGKFFSVLLHVEEEEQKWVAYIASVLVLTLTGTKTQP